MPVVLVIDDDVMIRELLVLHLRNAGYDARSAPDPAAGIKAVIDSPEVRALTPSAPLWIDDFELVTNDGQLRSLLDESGAVRIGYRHLRDAMRSGASG